MKTARWMAISVIAATSSSVGCDDGPTIPRTDDPVNGIITAIVIDDFDGSPVFLVEEQPNESDQGQKIFFNLSENTEIFINLPSGLLVRGTIADLAIGTRVRAWKGAIVTLSYPGATTAPRIDVIR